jgi:hypothetical protein
MENKKGKPFWYTGGFASQKFNEVQVMVRAQALLLWKSDTKENNLNIRKSIAVVVFSLDLDLDLGTTCVSLLWCGR